MSTPGRLIIVGGPPGAGKSTLAERLSQAHGAVRLSPDAWLTRLGAELGDVDARDRVEALQWQLTRELLERGVTVVLDWGVFTADKREALRRGAREIGAAVELHFLQAPAEELWERVRRRAADGGQPAPPRRIFDAIVAEVQPPDAPELAAFDAPG